MQVESNAPLPEPSQARAWAVAGGLFALGVAVLVAALTGLVGRSTSESPVPPPVPVVAVTPTAAVARAERKLVLDAVERTQPSSSAQRSAGAGGRADAGGGPAGGGKGAATGRALASAAAAGALTAAVGATQTHISRAWMSGFYPIYAQAQRVFGVNWLLLASIHRQESAFSTNPTTYHGLNYAGCCGGPMQFNVTNGPVSTWQLVSNAYLYGRRPAVYDHATATHPSIYDDFDAIMAAAWLLSSDGARLELDGSAWVAAYDYYGHDINGIAYADEVLARAIGWSQHGFCINCGVEPALLAAVHAAYGAPVQATLAPAKAPAKVARTRRRR